MARKAPLLAGLETLAGWPHRATVLEAKARVRSELRRREREQAAFELTTLAHEGASPLAALVPLLDEALLNLGESDRLALVLRFLEERSLREVGASMGVAEMPRANGWPARWNGWRNSSANAASRGRWDRPSVFAGSLHAAPPPLAALCCQALPAVASSGGLVKIILFHFI